MGNNLKKYRKDDRLADVLALLQMLALDRDDRSSEQEVKTELGSARSGHRWTTIAEEHPEFFRVRPPNPNDPESNADNKTRLSLLARHALPRERRDLFPIDFVETLIKTAIDLHDREVTRYDKRWLYVALIAAAAAVIAEALKIIFHTGLHTF